MTRDQQMESRIADALIAVTPDMLPSARNALVAEFLHSLGRILDTIHNPPLGMAPARMAALCAGAMMADVTRLDEQGLRICTVLIDTAAQIRREADVAAEPTS